MKLRTMQGEFDNRGDLSDQRKGKASKVYNREK